VYNRQYFPDTGVNFRAVPDFLKKIRDRPEPAHFFGWKKILDFSFRLGK